MSRASEVDQVAVDDLVEVADLDLEPGDGVDEAHGQDDLYGKRVGR